MEESYQTSALPTYGAEGNEAALKLAKLYGRTLPGALPSIGGKPARILAMTHGFHGRTMGALSATWKPNIRKPTIPRTRPTR